MNHAVARIGIIGAGRVGAALGRALAAAGYEVCGIASRSAATAERLAAELQVPVLAPCSIVHQADLTICAIPDDALPLLAADLSAVTPITPEQAVVHCSGVWSLEPLAALARQGWLIGGWHPLQAFAHGTSAVQAGITWGIEATEPLQSRLVALTLSVQGKPLLLEAGDKVLYHAAAVLAANYSITLAALAQQILGVCGVSGPNALAALLPLMQGNLAGLERLGIPAALTGPLARGDAGTVARHLTALDARAPMVAQVYRTLAEATLPLLEARGMAAEQVAALTDLLLA